MPFHPHSHSRTCTPYLAHYVAHHTLLPVSTTELVPQLWPPRVPNDELDIVVAVIVGCKGQRQ